MKIYCNKQLVKKRKKKNPPPLFFTELKNLLGKEVTVRSKSNQGFFSVTGPLEIYEINKYRVILRDEKIKTFILRKASIEFERNMITNIIENNTINLVNFDHVQIFKYLAENYILKSLTKSIY